MPAVTIMSACSLSFSFSLHQTIRYRATHHFLGKDLLHFGVHDELGQDLLWGRLHVRVLAPGQARLELKSAATQSA